MKIGIIGAGKVGGGLGKLWVRAGHQVLFSSRHPKRLRVLVEEAGLGAYLGDVGDAALFGDSDLVLAKFLGRGRCIGGRGTAEREDCDRCHKSSRVESKRQDGAFSASVNLGGRRAG